jgi:heme oxygenase
MLKKLKNFNKHLKMLSLYKGPVDGIFRADPIDEALDKLILKLENTKHMA